MDYIDERTVKIIRLGTRKIISVIILEMEHGGITIQLWSKDAAGTTISGGPGQIASST